MQIPETEIIVTKDGVELLRKTVRPGDYVIGREPQCEVQVEVELVSRRHAQLTVNFDHVLIEDLGSSNGTFVNGKPVTEPTRLWPNQKIQIGAATVELRRVKVSLPPDVSLAPQTASVQELLPEEFLREKKYDIGQVVAQGGMGAILDAKDATTERRVAMKVMLDGSSPADLGRFVSEARVTAQLEHPSIVPIYELSVDENGQPFYTMKMVRGITLRKVLELLAEGMPATVQKYPLSVLLTLFQKVCDAIAFAHSKGVLHRDLKPENIMLDDFGVVLVMDWGLAKRIGCRPSAPDGDRPASSDTDALQSPSASATMVGSIIGTPKYMAPEQARGEVETLDERADIYGLGAILYHLLALRPAVTGDDPMEVVEKVARGEIESIVAAVSHRRTSGRKDGDAGTAPLQHLPSGRIPESLAAVVGKAMAFDREARYRRVEDLQADIAAYQNGFATSAESAGAWKQFTLLIKRNKAASLGVAAVLLVGSVLGTKAILEGRRAEREAAAAKASLAELRATAPTFFAQAKLLTDQEKLADALEKIGIALKLNPDEASFHAQRGNILQSMERFAEAADAYAAAAKLNAQEPHAAENAALSRTLAAAKEKDGAISVNARTQWRDALVQQGRPEEAIFAGRGLGNDVQKMLPAWQAKIDAWLGKNAPRVGLRGSGFVLDLKGLSLTDLSPLRGMPLVAVNVDNNLHLQDLSPLADCPLETFSAEHASELADLSPLQGKKIKNFDLRSTNVSDLSPLAGMPLDNVSLNGSPVSDLTPLRGTKLRILEIASTKVRDLSALAGLPLERLGLKGAPIASLDPVADAPLSSLEIDVPFDLASLRAHRLRTLRVLSGVIEHPEELAKMTDLEVLILPQSFSDPAPLRNLPHLRKIDFPENQALPVESFKNAADFFRQYDAPPVRVTREAIVRCGLKGVPVRNVSIDPAGRLRVDLNHLTIGDLTPLHDLPINDLTLEGANFRDIEALRGMPLDTLNIRFTKVSDLEPLRGSSLAHLRVDSSNLKDVGPLAECAELESIELPPKARNVESLRALKKLRYLSSSWDNAANHPAQTVEEFWKEYDAKQAGSLRHPGEPPAPLPPSSAGKQ